MDHRRLMFENILTCLLIRNGNQNEELNSYYGLFLYLLHTNERKSNLIPGYNFMMNKVVFENILAYHMSASSVMTTQATQVINYI